MSSVDGIAINLISPSGVAMSLMICPNDDEPLMEFLDRADEGARAIARRDGWELADAKPVTAGSAEIQRGPTFCGFPCAPSVNALGFPAFIIAGERMAKRTEKQGDTWYSVKTGDSYERILSFRAGDEVPPVVGA